MKKATPKSVANEAITTAKAALKAKLADLHAAEEAVVGLRKEISDATSLLHEAMKAADAHLPQCRLVSVHWAASKEDDLGVVVIVRKTPGGMLVVRPLGASNAQEEKYKLNARGTFVPVRAKPSSFFLTSERQLRERQLRDVPPEFTSAVAD